ISCSGSSRLYNVIRIVYLLLHLKLHLTQAFSCRSMLLTIAFYIQEETLITLPFDNKNEAMNVVFNNSKWVTEFAAIHIAGI
ncbi:hypothetical protein L9F63_017409, partial [Diploptera punctata]